MRAGFSWELQQRQDQTVLGKLLIFAVVVPGGEQHQPLTYSSTMAVVYVGLTSPTISAFFAPQTKKSQTKCLA